MMRTWLYLVAMLLLVHSSISFQPAAPRSFHQSTLPKLATSSSQEETEKPYFLRKAVMADLSFVAQILADGFYDDRNPMSKWWEKLQTHMSLESNIPNPFLKQPHEMWVACDTTSGNKIVAFCEVDNRPPKPTMPPGQVRPYMCNLCVDKEWRKKGVALEMIRQCEASVESWLTSSSSSPYMHLKVRERNQPAVNLYSKLGYTVVATQTEDKTADTLLVMRREWTPTAPIGDTSSTTTIASEEKVREPTAQ